MRNKRYNGGRGNVTCPIIYLNSKIKAYFTETIRSHLTFGL